MLHLAPSILAANFSKLGEEINKIERAGASYLHLDVMDGAFVPSISFGMPIIKSLRPMTNMIFDVHMMVQKPERYIKDMVDSGADLICVHAEACTHLDRTIQQIKSYGKKVGVALNPATPINVLEYILDQVDMILIMSVNPGFGGQSFIPYTLSKIHALRQTLKKKGLNTLIQVDGGVTLTNIRPIIEAGANILVAGSSIFQGDAYKNTLDFLAVFEENEGV